MQEFLLPETFFVLCMCVFVPVDTLVSFTTVSCLQFVYTPHHDCGWMQFFFYSIYFVLWIQHSSFFISCFVLIFFLNKKLFRPFRCNCVLYDVICMYTWSKYSTNGLNGWSIDWMGIICIYCCLMEKKHNHHHHKNVFRSIQRIVFVLNNYEPPSNDMTKCR